MIDSHDLVCAAGTACLLAGVWCVYWPAALILAGLILIGIGGALAKSKADNREGK